MISNRKDDMNIVKGKVCIVSVFYNRAEVVEESVNSLIAQTYRSRSIILVDDGSSDDTANRLLKYKNQKDVKIISHQNIGFVRSIIKAIESDDSEFIAIHGSGDISLPERIEQQVSLLQNDEKIGVVGCWRKTVDENNTDIKEYKIDKSLFSEPDFLNTNPYSHGEVMYRREIYKKVSGYREEFKYSQDYDLWLRMSSVAKFSIVENILYIKKTLRDGVSYNCNTSIQQRKFSLLAKQLTKSQGHMSKNILADVSKMGIDYIIDNNSIDVRKRLFDRMKVFLYLGQYKQSYLCAAKLFKSYW